MGNRTTASLDIPQSAAERVARADEWKCAGCGALSPGRVRSCDCPTNVVCRGRAEQEWKIEKAQPAAAILSVEQGREAVAAWMMAHGYATGHGETIEDLLVELEGQARDHAVR